MKLLIKLSKYIAITLFVALGIFLHDFLKQQVKTNVQAAVGTLDIVTTTNTQDTVGARFLDKADTSYFIDPAATGNSLIVAGIVGIGTTTPASSDKVTITQSSTAANTTGLWVTGTGANTTGTSYGTYVSKDAGAGGTAVAGYFQAQGGTNNYGLIVGAGNVGIGTTAPVAQLEVVGGNIDLTSGNFRDIDLTGGGTTGASINNSGGIIRTTSDARLKTDIAPLDGALQKVLGLRGVNFNWIDTAQFGSLGEIGFIAQEVEQVAPEVVRKSSDDLQLRSVKTDGIVALTVEAIKEQQKKLLDLEDKIKRQQEIINQLQRTINNQGY